MDCKDILSTDDEFAVLRKVFRRFLNRKFEDPFDPNASSDSAISILILLCSGCRIIYLYIYLFIFIFPLTAQRKEKKRNNTLNTLEIYDNLKTKDNNFKGGNGKEAYMEAGGL